MMSTDAKRDVRVFLLPVDGVRSAENISFLFSQIQVAEIISHRSIQKVPFSPSYLLGTIVYQDELLPVVSLAELCNLDVESNNQRYKQLMIVRTAAVHPQTGRAVKVALVTTEAIRTIKLSALEMTNNFQAKEAPGWLVSSGSLRGFFQWQGEDIAMMHLDHLALGKLGSSSPERGH